MRIDSGLCSSRLRGSCCLDPCDDNANKSFVTNTEFDIYGAVVGNDNAHSALAAF